MVVTHGGYTWWLHGGYTVVTWWLHVHVHVHVVVTHLERVTVSPRGEEDAPHLRE